MKLAHTFYLCAALSCAALNPSLWGAQTVSCPYKNASFEMNVYQKDQISAIEPLLIEWTKREFAQFPYLWAPSTDDECGGNKMLMDEEHGQVVVVKKHDKVIGVAAVIAFDAPGMKAYLDGIDVKEMAVEQGFDPARLLYVCYFLTAPEHRNDAKLASAMYNQFADFAHSIGRNQICYFESYGDPNSSLKPDHLAPIEPWGHLLHGFDSMNVTFSPSWSTKQLDGTSSKEAHFSEFFYKDL